MSPDAAAIAASVAEGLIDPGDAIALMAPVCASCEQAEHPYEHRACLAANDGTECGCRCRQPKVAYSPPQRHAQRNPAAMLDLSEITIGCWVERGQSPDGDAVGRGGVVIGIDRVVDHDTGEMVRVFSTAREHRGSIRFAALHEADVDRIDIANLSIVRHLWRAMCREVAQRKRGLSSDETRLVETAYLLIRSFQ